MEELLNVKQCAAYLKCTEQTVRRYILAKKIPYHKIDRMVRFWTSELKEWVNNGKVIKTTGKDKTKNNADFFCVTETVTSGESQ